MVVYISKIYDPRENSSSNANWLKMDNQIPYRDFKVVHFMQRGTC